MADRIAILCACDRWSGAPRTSHALTVAGAEVCIVAPPNSYGAKTRFKLADMLVPPAQINRQLGDILRILAEDFGAYCVLAGDDVAFGALARLMEPAAQEKLSAATRAMLARSMPDAKTAALLASDHDFILAQQDSTACRSPRTIGAPTADEAVRFAQAHGYPVVVKRSGFASGMGVKICADEPALRTALEAAVRSGAGFVLQEFVTGRVYGATVSGVKGRALAAIAFEKHRVSSENGPTSVALFDPRADILAHAKELFERYGLNGYAGFDYIIDAQGRARFIEINPRVMPTGHFDEHFGVDLTGAFLAGIRGAPPPPVHEPLNRYVALFPNEWMRDPDSVFLRTGFHDVPWHDPAVLAAMIDKALVIRSAAEPQPFGDPSRLAAIPFGAAMQPALFGEAEAK